MVLSLELLQLAAADAVFGGPRITVPSVLRSTTVLERAALDKNYIDTGAESECRIIM